MTTSSPAVTATRPALLPERFVFGASLLLFALMVLLIRADLDVTFLLSIYQGAHAESVAFWTGVTQIGSTIGMVSIVTIFSIVLFHRKRHEAALWLIGGWAMTSLTVELVKWLIDRPRPSVPRLATAMGSSFPSGHAAESLFVCYFLWILLARTDVSKHGRLATALNEVCSMMLAGAPISVGYSRVYLGVHWPSDVVGGWAIGCFVLAIAVLSAASPLKTNADSAHQG